MNRHIAKALLIAVATVAAASAVHAQDATPDDRAFSSTRDRAEVLAELAQFKKSRVNPWAMSYNPPLLPSTRTRAEVQAEYIASREEVAALTGEDSGSAWLARQWAASHRPQVVAQTGVAH